MTAQSFSLVDEQWIPVLDSAGRRRDVSLRELFSEASELRMIACELPTQSFAVLRLALAILHRATGGPDGESAWRTLWGSKGLPQQDIGDYLDEFADRFDLLHPEHPFYQVADLRAEREASYGLARLIADVPSGSPFLITRAGPGMECIPPTEAALWLLHCQGWDPAGIKTGAVGDPRVNKGKGYSIGVGSLGSLGTVHHEGANVRETLLLNLVPVAPGWQRADDRDLPVWERPPQNAAEEDTATSGPFGLLSLYTWQSRRIRLFGDRDGITDAMVSIGDRIDWQDRHLLEPMSVWGRSAPREKAQKKEPIYLPRPHDESRTLWRGLQTLLPPPPSSGEPPKRLSPMVLNWLARLNRDGTIGQEFQARPRAISITYGTQQAVVDEVFNDALTMNVQLLVEGSELRVVATDAAADAEAAVWALRKLASNLVRAAGGSESDSGEADRAAEIAYGELDRSFRDWLARLGPASSPAEERRSWQAIARRVVAQIGDDLVAAAGEAAWRGRVGTDRRGAEVYYCSPQADTWFRRGLAKALPLAFEPSAQI